MESEKVDLFMSGIFIGLVLGALLGVLLIEKSWKEAVLEGRVSVTTKIENVVTTNMTVNLLPRK